MNLDELEQVPEQSGRNFALVHESCEWAEIVSAFGEIDISTAAELQSTITRHINGKLPLVMDLGYCDYLDSTILRVLVRTFRAGPERFAIVVPRKSRISRIFEMTRLDQTLRVAESRDAVRERFVA